MYVQETGRAVLYYSHKGKRLSEEMKCYCHDTITCVVLTSAFGIPAEIKKSHLFCTNAVIYAHVHATAQNVLMHYFVYIQSTQAICKIILNH